MSLHSDPSRESTSSDCLQPRCRLMLLSIPGDPLAALRAVIELTRCSLAEASRKLEEARNQGRALLLVTHPERAELLADQLATRGLSVRIE